MCVANVRDSNVVRPFAYDDYHYCPRSEMKRHNFNCIYVVYSSRLESPIFGRTPYVFFLIFRAIRFSGSSLIRVRNKSANHWRSAIASKMLYREFSRALYPAKIRFEYIVEAAESPFRRPSLETFFWV